VKDLIFCRGEMLPCAQNDLAGAMQVLPEPSFSPGPG
jgi:hypothetical protein